MSISSTMSQLGYVPASVLFVSGLAKMSTFRKVSSSSNAFGVKISPRLAAFLAAIIELVVAGLAVGFSSSDSPMRSVVIGAMALTYLFFTSYCLYSRGRLREPCLCFGSWGNKAPRTLSCVRNAVLCLMSVLALVSSPAGLSILGVGIVALGLGAILYEEIH